MTIRRFFETLDSGESSSSSKQQQHQQRPKRPRLQSTSKDSTDSVDSITTSDDEEQQRPYLGLPPPAATTRIDTKDEDGNSTTVRYETAIGTASTNNNEEGTVNDNDNDNDNGEEVLFDGLETSMPKPELSDYKAIQQAENSGKRKSSLYVDAFNLALDTVLEDESYLFDEEEHKIFEVYRKLEYQAQYL